MYKKTIRYQDYNGVEREEDFYFNLSKAEAIEMELSHADGFKGYIERIVASDNREALLKEFKELILLSYGEKSPDGKRFVKSKELSEAFAQTEAYVNLYVELVSDSDAAAAFVNGIWSASAAKEIAEKMRGQGEVVG